MKTQTSAPAARAMTKARLSGVALTAMPSAPSMERDRDGEAGEDETRRIIEGKADRLLVAERAGDKDRERGERILADRDDDEAGKRQRRGEVDERQQRIFRPGRELAVHDGSEKPLSPCGRGRGPLRSSGKVRGLWP